MAEVVKLERQDGVGIVTVNSPPVNALSAVVRHDLMACIKQAIADPTVEVIVWTGAGRLFCAGADISEFGRPVAYPDLVDIIAVLENSPKPIVAAINGVVFGGGLELALACHFRIAAKTAKLGLPEVKLGVLPGAGGTQRLPRAVGPELAVQMIATGNPIGAQKAYESGLADGVVAGDFLTGAIAFARNLLTEGRPLRRLRDCDDKLAAARADRSAFLRAADAATRKSRGLQAPHACVEAVGWALDLPFEEALTKEIESFAKLVHGDQSKAQRYAFFAEREAAKTSTIPAGTQARPVEHVAIVGAGTMGTGIAMSFVNAGMAVTLIDVAEEAVTRGLALMRKNWEATAARGGLAADAPARNMALVKGAVGLESVRDADLIIEAVFETMATKKDVFRKLDEYAKPGAVLASNTSFLDIDEISRVTARPRDVLGMHFFSPAHIMKLCEIARGEKTAPDALLTAITIAKRIGKVPVVVGACNGFVGNRMLAQRAVQAEKMLIEGALPQQVDAVLTRFGLPMGPFAMEDLAGLDIAWRSRKDRGITSPIPDALCESGRFGQKTGKGFYKYEEGSRTPIPDPQVDILIDRTAKEAGLQRRQISDEEILERMIYPSINEGARILAENIASRPSDIDVVWIHGYGWPVYRGGPTYWADRIGLDHIVDRLEIYAEQTNDPNLKPAPLLKKLAAEGKTFASLLDVAKAA